MSSAAEAYAQEHTTAPEAELASVADYTRRETEWPGMMSGVPEARLLEALIVAGGMRRVLEIGTFTAFGTLSMAAALPADGTITTLEVDPHMAEVARRHVERSSWAAKVEIILGDARATLERLRGPFDLVYIDAGKADYPAYYEAVVPMLSERGVVVADNLLRAGRVLDPGVRDEGTEAMREFADRVNADERVHNALLTVGDGLMVAWRAPAPGRT